MKVAARSTVEELLFDGDSTSVDFYWRIVQSEWELEHAPCAVRTARAVESNCRCTCGESMVV